MSCYKNEQYELCKYSNKSLVLWGNTKHIKKDLRKLGFCWNVNIKNRITNKIQPGFILPIKNWNLETKKYFCILFNMKNTEITYETVEEQERYNIIVKNLSFCLDSKCNVVEINKEKEIVFDLWKVFGKHDISYV
uniref:Uncharacterized protein n=1 Tax=Pithovirus LCDPAC02 TaxID=2506601 RepID=A0A481YR95_9VIRU|nr:MAG: hypothetical protein LCDPAC02_01930 [Pithovirus LCDPAC02]